MARSTLLSVFLVSISFFLPVLADLASDCACGYYDSGRKQLFTDAIIVYFNETNGDPTNVFAAEAYEHYYEKAWNALFRSGASVDHVTAAKDGNDSYVSLLIDPTDTDHLVVGCKLI